MTSVFPPTTLPVVEVRLWRHHATQAHDIPGMSLGTRTVSGGSPTAAADLFAQGARRVALADLVDLAAAAEADRTVSALIVVRDLTSYGIVVDWRVRLATPPAGWELLSHLYPPTEVVVDGDPAQGAAVAAGWRSEYFMCRCVDRQGPGFVQVRDRRSGELNRFTIDDPDYLAAIDTLRHGAPASAIPESILAAYLAEGLVMVVGELAWWLPYRVRRWPGPPNTM